jgi:hypothetical protein
MEYVENDLRKLKVKIWRQMANSGEEWACVLKEAEVPRGLKYQGVSK